MVWYTSVMAMLAEVRHAELIRAAEQKARR
jgi:hypothetical protein